MLIEVLDNIVDKDYYNLVINSLYQSPCWYPSLDEEVELDDLNKDKSDSGFLIMSYNCDKPEVGMKPDHNYINHHAYNLFQLFLMKSSYRFKDVDLKRYLWNYYNKSSDGVLHCDSDAESFFSIVFYLKDSDGGTYVENEFIEDACGRAVLFKSNTPHRGKGPTIFKNRFCLNVVFQASDYGLKNE